MTTYNENAVHHIMLYVDNSRDIYCQTEMLFNSLVKRMKKGKAVEIDHLAQCSTMRNIINAGARMAVIYDNISCTNADKMQARRQHAAYIIECAEYLANA